MNSELRIENLGCIPSASGMCTIVHIEKWRSASPPPSVNPNPGTPSWINRMLPIALAHGTGSPEWQAEVDATAPRLHDETFARARLLIAALCSCLGFCILTSGI